MLFLYNQLNRLATVANRPPGGGIEWTDPASMAALLALISPRLILVLCLKSI
jgi:hypothetical protein